MLEVYTDDRQQTVSSDGKSVLTIAIVNWNTCDITAQCLASVEPELDDWPAGAVETIVVDNGSTDASVPTLRQRFPWITLLENSENLGFARANNQAIECSSGEYVLLLNSDTVVHYGALRRLVAFMQTTPLAGACTAKLLNADDSLQAACHPMMTPGSEFWRLMMLERMWRRSAYPLASWDDDEPHRVDVIKGACLLLRRCALGQVGLLDEQYFMYTEEVDLCHRLAAAGWQLWYLPDAVVTHLGGESSKQDAEQMYLELYRSKVQFFRKVGGDRHANRYKFYLRLAYLPRVLITHPVLPNRRLRAMAPVYRRLLQDLPQM